MPFITVNADGLEVKIVSRRPTRGVVIPTESQNIDFISNQLANTTFFAGLYPYHYSKISQHERKSVAFALIKPDPWLLAVVAIMWEGILQGLAWDLVKAAVLRAVDRLRGSGLAPNDRNDEVRRRSTKRSSKLGVAWTEFSEDGRPLRELFIGLKRDFESRSEIERIHVTRPDEWERLRDEHLKTRIEEARRQGEDVLVLGPARQAARKSSQGRERRRKKTRH